jgi:hypothetical protein
MAVTKLPGTQINTISSTNIAAGAVDSTALASAAVISGKIGVGAIDAANLFAAGVVDSAALGDNSVDTNALQAASVTNNKMANNAVSSNIIAANAVTAAKLNADVAGAGLFLNAGSNAIDIGLGVNSALAIASDALTVALDGSTLQKNATGLSVNQSASFNFSSVTGTLSADFSANGFKITALASPTTGSDAANKAYVDSVAQGLDIKGSCLAATTGPLPAAVYANGTAGVGATLTASVNGALGTVDGVTLVAGPPGSRVLVKNQADAVQNGIYVVTALGDAGTKWVLTRSSDFNSSNNITSGAFTFVEQGTIQSDTGWAVSTDGSITVGTTGIIFTQFSGAGAVLAGNGLTRNGNVISALLNGGASGNQVPAIDISASGLAVKVDNTSININGSAQLQVAANGISTSMIQAGAVGTTQLAGTSVVTGKIADANVTKAKLNSDVTQFLGALDSMGTAAVSSGTETVNFANSATAADRDAALLVFLNGALLTPGASNDYIRNVTGNRTTGFTLQRSGTTGGCTYFFGG